MFSQEDKTKKKKHIVEYSMLKLLQVAVAPIIFSVEISVGCLKMMSDDA